MMSEIALLEKQIDQAASLLEAAEAAALENKESFARQLSVKTYRAHLNELRSQLRQEKLDRSSEVVRFRLIGRKADHGSLPLYLLSKVSSEFAAALHSSAQKLSTGKRVRRISSSVVQKLDLRLAGITEGSTNLVITGNLDPDLFGNSLLEDSLHHIFALLNADVETELAERVAEVGIRGAHEIRALLRTLYDADLEAELTWRTPSEETREWRGTRHRISLVSSMLSEFQITEPEEVQTTGLAVTVSLRRPFEMDADGKIITASVPHNLISRIQELHVGQEVAATFQRNVVVNAVTGTEKVDYVLVDVHPTGQQDLRTSETAQDGG